MIGEGTLPPLALRCGVWGGGELDMRRGLLVLLFEEEWDEWDVCWSIVICGDGVAKIGGNSSEVILYMKPGVRDSESFLI